jgi:hypothetical protein
MELTNLIETTFDKAKTLTKDSPDNAPEYEMAISTGPK